MSINDTHPYSIAIFPKTFRAGQVYLVLALAARASALFPIDFSRNMSSAVKFDLSKGLLSTYPLNTGLQMPVVGLGMYRVEVGESAYEVALEGLRQGYRCVMRLQRTSALGGIDLELLRLPAVIPTGTSIPHKSTAMKRM